MKKILHAVCPLLMALVMLLPLCLSVSALETTVTGYAFSYDSQVQRGGYLSQWCGDTVTIRDASWGGAWVSTDGAYQGCIQWTKTTQITLDNATGVLTFTDVGNTYNIRIQPQQNAKLAMDVYPFVMSFDTKPTTGSFSGIVLGSFENGADKVLLNIDENGEITFGNSKLSTGLSLNMDTWNTVTMYFVPTYGQENSTHTGYTVYLDTKETDTITKSWGIPDADLTGMKSFEWPATQIINSSSSAGPMYLKGMKVGTGTPLTFQLADFRIFRMIPNSALYKVAFDGFPDLTAYVPVGAGNDTESIIVPGAEGVQFWTAGEGVDAEYLTPGETKRIIASKIYTKASGAQMDIASLMSAVNALDLEGVQRGDYRYSELSYAADKIEAAITAALDSGAVSDQEGGTNYAYYERAEEAYSIIYETMITVADNAESLIAAAAIFNDQSLSLDERLEAYRDVADLQVDITYSAACEKADTQRSTFRAMFDVISEDYAAYQEELATLPVASGTQLTTLLKSLIDRVIKIRKYTDFAYDDILDTKYEEYIASQAAAVRASTGIVEKYAKLEELVTLYNKYNKGIGRAKTVPDTVMGAIDDYNAAVAAANREILDAVKIAGVGILHPMNNNILAATVKSADSIITAKTPTKKETD